jgi:hypothetical protein
MNTLKYFRIQFQIRRAIRLLKCQNFDSALCNIARSQFFLLDSQKICRHLTCIMYDGLPMDELLLGMPPKLS